MVANTEHVRRLPFAEPFYRLPLGFEGRRGYRAGFVFDGGRHVVDWYRRRDRPLVLVMFCARCGLRFGADDVSCATGRCLDGGARG